MRLVSGTYTHQIEENGKTYVVTTGTYEIDPTSAQRLLNTTGKQRPIYKANVRKITRAHINKLWKYLGDTIKLDQYGNLLDGAHRLQAAIDAGVTIIVMIVSGLPAQYFEYMDTSKSRGIKDALTIHGVKNAEVTRQVLTFLWQLGNTSNPKEIPTPPRQSSYSTSSETCIPTHCLPTLPEEQRGNLPTSMVEQLGYSPTFIAQLTPIRKRCSGRAFWRGWIYNPLTTPEKY